MCIFQIMFKIRKPSSRFQSITIKYFLQPERTSFRLDDIEILLLNFICFWFWHLKMLEIILDNGTLVNSRVKTRSIRWRAITPGIRSMPLVALPSIEIYLHIKTNLFMFVQSKNVMLCSTLDLVYPDSFISK